jgi:hypothetical protein
MPADYQDWLYELRRNNVSPDDVLMYYPHGYCLISSDYILPLPPMGDLDVIQMYFFSPYAFD